MLCCATGVAAVATGAIGWRRFRRFLHIPLKAQSLLAAGAAAVAAITIGALTVDHFRIHTAHASDDLLPFCRGSDRSTNIASSED